MGICETVAALADAVAASHAPLSDRQRRLHEALRSMPRFAAGDLGAWEVTYQEAVPDAPSPDPVEALLDEVFDFGRHTLYRAFDPEKTAQAFGRVVERLQRCGVGPLPTDTPQRW